MNEKTAAKKTEPKKVKEATNVRLHYEGGTILYENVTDVLRFDYGVSFLDGNKNRVTSNLPYIIFTFTKEA